jgi:hypothetical protein
VTRTSTHAVADLPLMDDDTVLCEVVAAGPATADRALKIWPETLSSAQRERTVEREYYLASVTTGGKRSVACGKPAAELHAAVTEFTKRIEITTSVRTLCIIRRSQFFLQHSHYVVKRASHHEPERRATPPPAARGSSCAAE